MLVGTIKYRDIKNNKTEVFQVKGVDTSSTFQCILSTFSCGGVDLMDGVENSDGLVSRRMNVNMSSVKVQTQKVWNEEKQKEVPKPINTDFFVNIASVLRYAKSHCYKKNAVNYTGVRISSGEFSPEVQTTYSIPIDSEPQTIIGTDGKSTTVYGEQKYLGEVTLNLGEIQAVHLSTDLLEIDIEEDASIDLIQMYDFKVHQVKGFKFDSEHLKFYVEPPKVNNVQGGDSFGLYTSLDDIIKNNPDKDYDWLLSRQYYIVDDDMLEDVCKMFLDHDGYIAFDTETTGLKINFKSRIGQADQLVGVVLSKKVGESYYFPCQHKCIENLCKGDHWFFMEKYMRAILETKELIAHNMSYDWKVAYIYDINANIVHDTMAMFKLTYGAEKDDFRVGLKELARMFLNRDSLELSNMVYEDSWGESDIKFWDLPYELVRLYANADTDNTLELFQYAQDIDLLHKYNAQRVYEIEITFSLAVAYQEFYGHKIDTEKIEELKKRVEEGIEVNKKLLFDEVGYEFNPSSSPQLQRIMYDELGIPKKYSRKTGNLTTDKDTLKELAELEDIDGNTMYPFVKYLQKYREYDGIRKNFIKGLPDLSTEDGYLFSDVQQYGTTTGRVSIKKPNYQSYNNVVKHYIVPRPHFYNTDNDYSSIEYRVLGSMAQQPELITAFGDPELDYHSYQASRMFNVPYEAVTSQLRKSAKGINFGLPYGMGDKSLGIRIFGKESAENTRKAGILRKKYFIGQEKIQDFFEEARDMGVKEGYTETYYGRRRYYHKNKFSISAIRRQAGNQVIQGSAADIYKLAVGRTFLRICQEGWLGKVLFTAFVHDELLCEVHESIDPIKFMKVIRECFEVEIEGFCQLYVGFGFGTHWYQAKSTEIPTKLQQELCDKYGETGYPLWKGNSQEFCDSVPTLIRDYQIRATAESITDVANQGSTIKPMINTYLTDTLKDDEGIVKDVYLKALKTLVSDEELEGLKKVSISDVSNTFLRTRGISNFTEDIKAELLPLFKAENIQEVVTDLGSSKDLQLKLDQFCLLHNIDRSLVNQISSSEVSSVDNIQGETEEVRGYEFDIEDPMTAEELENLKATRVDIYGLHVNFMAEEVTLKLIDNNAFMGVIHSNLNNKREGLRVFLKDCENDKTYETPLYCESKVLSHIQNLYFEFSKQLAEHLSSKV